MKKGILLIICVFYVILFTGCLNSNSTVSSGNNKKRSDKVETSNCATPYQIEPDYNKVLETYDIYSSVGKISVKKHPLVVSKSENRKIIITADSDEYKDEYKVSFRLSFLDIPFTHLSGPVSLWDNDILKAQISAEDIFLVDMGVEHGIRIFYIQDHYSLGGPLAVIVDGVYKKGRFVDYYEYKLIPRPIQGNHVVISGPISENNTFLPISMFSSDGSSQIIGKLRLDKIKDIFEYPIPVPSKN